MQVSNEDKALGVLQQRYKGSKEFLSGDEELDVTIYASRLSVSGAVMSDEFRKTGMEPEDFAAALIVLEGEGKVQIGNRNSLYMYAVPTEDNRL